jgi:hypothetical protein
MTAWHPAGISHKEGRSMKHFARNSLAALLMLAPLAVTAQDLSGGSSMLARNVQNHLDRFGFDDVDASSLSTNQLAGIKTALSSRELSRTDKRYRVEAILRR